MIENLPQTGFERRILPKMANLRSYCNKEICEVDSSFKKQKLRGKVYI